MKLTVNQKGQLLGIIESRTEYIEQEMKKFKETADTIHLHDAFKDKYFLDGVKETLEILGVDIKEENIKFED